MHIVVTVQLDMAGGMRVAASDPMDWTHAAQERLRLLAEIEQRQPREVAAGRVRATVCEIGDEVTVR
jgi:hypothetical protein